VAERWLDGVTSDFLWGAVQAELGVLLAQAGDFREGIGLIRAGSDRFFALACEDALRSRPDPSPIADQEQVGPQPRGTHRDALLATACQSKYEAAAWGLRTRSAMRTDAVAELRAIQDTDGAPEGSEAWFDAGFELIAAEACPVTRASNVVRAEQLLRQLGEADLPAAARDRLEGHARQVLGHALHFGNNRFLHTRARNEFQAAVPLFEAGGDWSNVAQTLDALGRVCSQLGDHAAAEAAHARGMRLKQHLKDFLGLGASFNGLAGSRMRSGRAPAAVPFLDANLELIEHTPEKSLGLVLQNLGQKASACMAE
jgi:hypothetical protein